MVPLKYLSNFLRTLEIPLITCEINLFLTWSEKCVTASNNAADQTTTFAITDTKLYIPVVTLSTQDNSRLLQQLKSGLKRTINWNNYQSKVIIQTPKLYLDYLIDPSFQRINRIFVLSFENTKDKTVHTKRYLPAVKIKDCNVLIRSTSIK